MPTPKNNNINVNREPDKKKITVPSESVINKIHLPRTLRTAKLLRLSILEWL